MKIERTKNATRNIIFGSALKLYQIVLPFFMRTAINYFLGIEYLGLNSLFTSILQVLNLAELGVGSAMVYSMYKPIAEDNKEEICALMRLYRTYYRIIGVVVAALGLILLPFIPNLIKDEVPADINIYILYLLNLSSTVLSYWLFAYKNCLFIAHQRVDISSKIVLITNVVQYLVQFLVLYFIRSYYIYIIVLLVTQACTNIITGIVATHVYPDYKPIGKLKNQVVKEINKRIRDLFTSKIGMVIVNSVDTITISTFLGLRMLAVYQNYYYILTSIMGLVTIIFNSCIAGIGNSLIVESVEKNYRDLKKFTFIVSWISGICTVCLLCLYQPFMEIWMGNDKKLEFAAVISLCIYYYIQEINQLLTTYKDAAGIWHEDRLRPLVTAFANLGMNLIMVQFWGIYGVIFSTVLSTLIIGMPWLLNNLFTIVFDKKDLSGYLKKIIFYVIGTLITCIVCGGICSCIHWGKWGTFIVRAMVCFILSNLIFLVFYYKQPEFFQTLELIDKMTHNKLSISKHFGVKTQESEM